MGHTINSKKKGSKNERHLAKIFKLWTGYDFARTPSSGGLRWQRTLDTVGDIICTDKKHSRRFPFSIETKFHKDIRFDNLLLDFTRTKIIEFWDQAREDGERGNKIPLLLMRYNNLPRDMYFLVLAFEQWQVIKKHIPTAMGLIRYKATEKGYDFVILNSNDLFKANYKAIYHTLKEK